MELPKRYFVHTKKHGIAIGNDIVTKLIQKGPHSATAMNELPMKNPLAALTVTLINHGSGRYCNSNPLITIVPE